MMQWQAIQLVLWLSPEGPVHKCTFERHSCQQVLLAQAGVYPQLLPHIRKQWASSSVCHLGGEGGASSLLLVSAGAQHGLSAPRECAAGQPGEPSRPEQEPAPCGAHWEIHLALGPCIAYLNLHMAHVSLRSYPGRSSLHFLVRQTDSCLAGCNSAATPTNGHCKA